MRNFETPDFLLEPPDDDPELPSSGIQPDFDSFFEWMSDLKSGSLEHSIVTKAIKEQSPDAWSHALELLQEHIDRNAYQDLLEKQELFCEECNQ